MIHLSLKRLLLICFTPVALAFGSDILPPSWMALENRMYQHPQLVLNELEQMTIDAWPAGDQASYYDLLAGIYLIFSDYDSAEDILDQAWSLLAQANPYVQTQMRTTYTYFRELNGEDDGIEQDYLTALRLAEQSADPDAVLLALNNLITYYSFTREDYEKALALIHRGSLLTGQVKRKFLVADLHNYFGSVMSYLGDQDNALQHYQIAENIYLSMKNNVSLSDMLYNQALLLEDAEDYHAALRAYQAFLEKATAWGDPSAAFFGNLGIANNYFYLERYQAAYDTLHEARKDLQYIVDPVYQFDFWLSAITIAADVDDDVLANEAVDHAKQLIDQLMGGEASWYQSRLLSAQTYLSKSNEDYESALKYSEALLSLQYGLLNAERDQALIDSRIKSESSMYQSETDRLARENQQQQVELAAYRQQKRALLVLLAISLSGAVYLFFNLRRKNRQMYILQEYSAITEAVKTSGHQAMENVTMTLFDQSERHRAPLSVVMLDFANMSDIREQFGQSAVDAATLWIEEALEAELRKEDRCGQISFNRFMLLLPGIESRVAKKHAERLVQYFNEVSMPKWPQIRFELVVGISERSRHDRNPNILMHRAATAVDLARDKTAPIKVLVV